MPKDIRFKYNPFEIVEESQDLITFFDDLKIDVGKSLMMMLFVIEFLRKEYNIKDAEISEIRYQFRKLLKEII